MLDDSRKTLLLRERSQLGKIMAGMSLAAVTAAMLTAAPVLALDVEASVGIDGGVSVDACVGSCDSGSSGGTGSGGTGTGGTGTDGTGTGTGTGGTGTGGTGTGGTGIGTGGGGAGGLPVMQASAVGGQGVCSGGGNSHAYDGVGVIDRDGYLTGWVHDATLTRNGNLRSVRILTNPETVGRSLCVTLGPISVGNLGLHVRRRSGDIGR